MVPSHRLVLAGDGPHEIARFRHRHHERLTPVGESHPEANLLAPPPPCHGLGRPRVKGTRLPKPREAAGWRHCPTVAWCGGQTGRAKHERELISAEHCAEVVPPSP
jgi:hypothetical protein